MTKHPTVGDISTRRHSIGDGALTTRTSLSLDSRLQFGQWHDIGKRLSFLHDSSAWWLGDWLIYGQRKYPKRYAEAAAHTDIEYQTLRNYAWTARRFAPARRRAQLSFQHHAEVTSLSDAEQDVWLDRAQTEGWSKTRLRQEIRAAGRSADRAIIQVTIAVESSRQLLWTRAAADNHSRLSDWIVSVLDEAARLKQIEVV